MDTNKVDFDISRLKHFVWNKKPWIATLILGATALVLSGLVVAIFLARVQPEGFWRSFSSTFSNIMGPVVGGVAAVFALLAFYVQYRANEQTNKQFEIQRLDAQFNNLLSAFQKSQENYMIDSGVKLSNGRACLGEWANEFRNSRKLAYLLACPSRLDENGNLVKPLQEGDDEDELVNTLCYVSMALPLFSHNILEELASFGISKVLYKDFLKKMSQVSEGFFLDFASGNSGNIILYNETKAISVSITGEHVPCRAWMSTLPRSIALLSQMCDFISNDIEKVNILAVPYYQSLVEAQLDPYMSSIYLSYLRSAYGRGIRAKGTAKFILDNAPRFKPGSGAA